MEFTFLLNTLFRKKWVIISCTLAGVLAALFFILTRQKLYLSAAQYSTGFTMKQAVKIRDDEGLNIFEIDQRFNNVIETFRSPIVIGMISYDLMLHDLEDPQHPFRILNAKELQTTAYKKADKQRAKNILWRKRDSLTLLMAYNPEEQNVYELIKLYKYDNETIKKRLTVDRIPGTDFLNILYRSENPELSAYVVNTIGKEFFRFFYSINSVRMVQSVTKLDSLADRKKQEMDRKTENLRKFKAGFGTPNVDDRATGAMQMAQEYASQLTQEEAKLNTAREQLSATENQLNQLPTRTTANTNSNIEIITLQNENRELAKDYNNPAAQAKINANRTRILALQQQPGMVNRLDLQKREDELRQKKIDLEVEVAGLSKTVNSYKTEISRYNTIAQTGGGLDVEVKSRQEDLDMTLKEYQSLKSSLINAENVDVSPDINFKQTLLGQPAVKPEPGNSRLILAMTAIASFVISAFLIIIMDFLDNSLRAPSIFQKEVKLKLLAAVNTVGFKEDNISRYFNYADHERLDHENLFIENLRKLRFEIESSGKKIFLFTSTKHGEGKSTIVEALANSFSLSKKRVLLIDSNFSNNTLTEKFKAKPLLDQFSMNGEKNGAEKLSKIISATTIPYTDIVGCNKGNFSPSEILPEKNLLENLHEISSGYDYVFLEGAALNDHADSKELSKYADGIIPVFSARSAIRQNDKESISFLKSNKEKLVGAVLNMVEEENISL